MTVLLLVTLVSMLLAIVMSAIAWRVSHDERRRADARVVALAADIEDAVAETTAAAQPVPRRAVVGRRSEPATVRSIRPAATPTSELFATSDLSSASSRSVVVGVVGLFVFATAAALSVVLSNGSRGAVNPTTSVAPQSRPAAPTSANPANSVPLELVALGHERDGDHLIVRGVIRNPAAGARFDKLVVVVFVFDAEGGFVTSGRATIDNASLLGGGESSFLVNIPNAARVARYRISFRTDTVVIPHVDRRHAG
jgi:hypothetical protein